MSKFNMPKESAEIKIAVIHNNIEYIKGEVTELASEMKSIRLSLDKDYVTREEVEDKFKPLNAFMYGTISLILATVLVAILSLVIRK